jgi:hypothetical protein
MGFGLTPSFGDRRGFMPPQLKTKQNKNLSDLHVKDLYPLIDNGNKVPMILRYNSPL